MSRGTLLLFKILLIFFSSNLFASTKPIMDFDVIKKGQDSNDTLLVFGGIQGDEPGGFLSASILATHYKIKKGSLWIVPNLNFYSIIKRSRGPYGDMNRKFKSLSKKDPEYPLIQKVKTLITDKNVTLIVNLHDGSGYFRPKTIDKKHSPYTWGQCSVIDQSELNTSKYGHLGKIAKSVVDHINAHLLKEEDKYHIHNTHTAKGDKEMEKTLSYFAVLNNKAALANEASKELPTYQRVYYHLLALEKYMQIMNIEYSKDFKLTPAGVKYVINNNIFISLYNNKITLPLTNLRNDLYYFPITKDKKIKFQATNPLVTILQKKGKYLIQYGNRKLTFLHPEYINYDDSNDSVKIAIDGNVSQYPFGSIIDVKDNFLVKDSKKYRVNVIGFVTKNKKETDIKIKKSSIIKRFSIDKKGTTFRIEFYNKKKFSGMILVRFLNQKTPKPKSK